LFEGWLRRMVISGISVDGSRLSATVEWEDNDRPKQVLWFESAAVPLAPSAEAFLVGCAAPAMRDREKRLLIHGSVDPALLESVAEALAWIMSAFGYEYPAPVLEATHVNRSPAPRGRHAGMLSCGVDSLAMLRLNHARYAPSHPRRIAAGVVIGGFDCVTPAQYAQLMERAHAVGEAAGIEVLDVNTNIAEVAQWPHPTRPFPVFSPREYQACILIAAAHALSGRISSVSVASWGAASLAVAFQRARGSHPLLDPLYGSSSMRVFHADGTVPRLQKLRIVADWDVAMKNLLVCSKWDRPLDSNCGRCGKCVRAMLEFVAVGKLDSSPFRGYDVSAGLVRSTHVTNDYSESPWRQLIAPLMAVGRADLAQAVQTILGEYRGRKRIAAAKERAKEFDSRYFGGLAVRLNRFARHA
jgi:hypothetical protein